MNSAGRVRRETGREACCSAKRDPAGKPLTGGKAQSVVVNTVISTPHDHLKAPSITRHCRNICRYAPRGRLPCLPDPVGESSVADSSGGSLHINIEPIEARSSS